MVVAGGASLIALSAELTVLLSLFAELLMLTLTAPVDSLGFLQAVNLIPMLARRMRAVNPPAQMSGILRFE